MPLRFAWMDRGSTPLVLTPAAEDLLAVLSSVRDDGTILRTALQNLADRGEDPSVDSVVSEVLRIRADHPSGRLN